MIFEIENLNSKIQNGDFFLKLDNNLGKKERMFLNMLIKLFNQTDDLKIIISTDNIKKNLNIKEYEIYSFLERLYKKSFSYKILLDDKNISGTFNIISSFFISDKNICIFLPKELKEEKKIKTLFSVLNFKYLYNFTDKSTYIFYSAFFKNFILKKSFEVKFEELKNILRLENKYDRFFDFEKNVIKNIIGDLENFYKLKYEKIKIGTNVNNKIVGFRFSFGEYLWEEDDNLKLKSTLFIIKHDIVDPAEVYSVLKKGIENYGYDTIYKACFKAKKSWKKSNINFDDYLKFIIENLEKKDLEPQVLINRVFSSPASLRTTFINEMEKLKPNTLFDSTFFSNEFLKDLYTFNDDKILNFQNEEISVIINWKKNEKSTIKIYLL